MSITGQDPDVRHAESVLRKVKARIARSQVPNAPEWDTNPLLLVSDLTDIVEAISFPPKFVSVYDFMDRHVSTHYRRQVTDISDTVWCPEWFKHEEALENLGLLWDLYEETFATGTASERLDFVTLRVPSVMQKLLDPRGPFKYCSVRNGHKDMLAPLPIGKKMAPELFPDYAPAITDAA